MLLWYTMKYHYAKFGCTKFSTSQQNKTFKCNEQSFFFFLLFFPPNLKELNPHSDHEVKQQIKSPAVNTQFTCNNFLGVQIIIVSKYEQVFIFY